VDELVVSTQVHAPAGEVYDLLEDLERYDRYSKYLRRVRRATGDGGAGTRYALEFAWWKLTYTARSTVTDVDPPNRIDWRITKDIDANGHWLVDPIAGEEAVCDVEFRVNFDPDSADSGALDLPFGVSFDWVLAKAIPLFRSEAERVVERAVADLEGDSREVDLDVVVDSEHL